MSSYDKIIKEHYDSVAKADKDSASSTMSNNFIRQSETDFIVNQIHLYLSKHKLVDNDISFIDIGCGNGYTLDELSSSFKFDFHGIELTESLRKIANDRLGNQGIRVSRGDIRRSDDLPQKKFQILLCQRVLINLLDKNDQEEALNNLISLVKKGGLLIFIECFNESLDNLNKIRESFLLDPMKPSHHNLYLANDILNNERLAIFNDTQKNFLSMHYFVSRVLHPLYLNYNNLPFERNSEFVNKLTKSLPVNIGEYSPLKFLSFTKC
tara:strand:- start:213 stop:1013 length:801 start_codon:yes stop_codon:yes gene_type:complete